MPDGFKYSRDQDRGQAVSVRQQHHAHRIDQKGRDQNHPDSAGILQFADKRLHDQHRHRIDGEEQCDIGNSADFAEIDQIIGDDAIAKGEQSDQEDINQ